MANNKEQYITIQNLLRYVTVELDRLDLRRDQTQIFLNCLSSEISKLNESKLEQVSRIGSN